MKKLRRILLTLTPELLDVLDVDLPTRGRNELIENLLWQHPLIRKKANGMGIKRKERNKAGGYERN